MRRMERQPDGGPGGDASSAEISSANTPGIIIGPAVCGTSAALNGRVAEYVLAGLTAVWSGCAWQQVWLAGIMAEPH